MNSEPKFSFKFDQNEYQNNKIHSLPSLKFFMGSYENEQKPPYIKLCHFYLDYLIKSDEKEKFRSIDERDEQYKEVIKHPMYFNKIKEKLNKNQYPSLESFKNDVDLIWSNCIQFNGTTSQIGIYSMKLRSNFNELWELHNSIKNADQIDAAIQSVDLKDEAYSYVDSINLDMFKFPDYPPLIQEKPKKVKEKNFSATSRRPVEIKNEKLNENLTPAEKQKLARRIDNLIPALLGDVIDILRDSLHLDLTKEVIIPFSDIDTPILRRIEATVKEAKTKEQSVKRMYQNEQMPSEMQIEILKRESKKFEDLLAKKSTVGSESSSDNDTDTGYSSDKSATSSSDDYDS